MAEAAAAAPVSLPSAAAAAGKSPLPAFPDNPPVGGWTRQVTCRYFMHGVCKEGNNCRYSHDLSTSRSAMICRYYQRGCCAYGDHCRYEHTKPLKQEIIGDASGARSSPPESLPETSSDINSKKAASEVAAGVSQAEDWVNAVEFVPGQLYCGRAPSGPDTDTQGTAPQEENKEQPADPELKKQLCPYATVGECRYGENCVYLHGDPCDMCGLQVLHPTDTSQRSQHIKSCIEAHEKDMELSFAIQRSKDIVCGICMEVVYEKTNPSERRFGILSNCSHSYCLKCIRRWRSAKQFESKIIKSCPECRITSNFVIPSEYWVEEKEEKQKLIQKYKEAMSNKSCRYFDEGRGTCPFGGNCFYKHAYPDGRIEEPQPRQKGGMSSRYRAQRRNRFWDFEEREGSDPFDNDDEEVMTFELGEMLLMLLAAGADDDLTDSEDEWDLFHEDLDDFYDLDL
ncbi:E3 ubiquitin-protein ligase makorin-1 isoform X1 [Dendropsophus ebraccatus]|uniref:E3 ubiquitin-protein ligase makorin-1 isoform X1 n=1 Tax=Dendropsophus ebraccatus TaxID=150705 RepID=UPI003831125E